MAELHVKKSKDVICWIKFNVNCYWRALIPAKSKKKLHDTKWTLCLSCLYTVAD